MHSTKRNQHTKAELPHSEILNREGNQKNWLMPAAKLISSRTKGATRASASFILVFWLTNYCHALTKESPFAAQINKAPNYSKNPTSNPATTNILTRTYETARIADCYEKKYNLERKDLLRIISIAFENAQEKKINPFVVLAIISHESNFVANVKNNSGATGLMQIVTQVHHNRFKPYGGSHSALKPEVNIKIGTEILEECIRKMKSVRRGLRCYAGTVNGNDRGFSDYVLREATYVKNKSKKQNPVANI